MRLIYHPAARREERDAARRYWEENPALAKRFRDKMRPVLLRIGTSPQQFPTSLHGTRRALVAVFPYAIFFIQLDEAIYIVAVAHTSREPGYWRNRLPT
jgi:plasmid stabilization system protein ParE